MTTVDKEGGENNTKLGVGGGILLGMYVVAASPALLAVGIFKGVREIANLFVSPEERAARAAALKREAEENEARRQKNNEIQALGWKNYRQEQLAKYRALRTEIETMPKYQAWKEAVYTKYGRRCEICNESNSLEIHHRESFYSILRQGNINTKFEAFEYAPLWDIDNGAVLCKSCHANMESSKVRQMLQ